MSTKNEEVHKRNYVSVLYALLVLSCSSHAKIW